MIFPSLEKEIHIPDLMAQPFIFTMKKKGLIKCIPLPVAVKGAKKTAGSRKIGLVLRWDRLFPHNKFSEKTDNKDMLN
jgi:hypothetical protein